jgi:hypothetical protein
MYWLGAAAIVVLWLWVLQRPTDVGPDLEVYSRAVSEMREGHGYYQAMYDALSAVNGPPSEARSYRFPTVFYLWQFTGLTWPVVLAVIILIGWEVSMISHPVVGVICAAYLATIARPPSVPAVYGWVEIWALPLVLAAILAIRRDRWTLAALCVLAAALVRETVAPVLVSGAVAAWLAYRPLRPWLIASAAWVAFLAWHLGQVPLSPTGTEMSLVGTGGLWSALNMAGPAIAPVGAIATVVALWRARFTPEWWLSLPLLVGIPLTGFIVSRDYWGILVFPIALALAGPQPHGPAPDASLERSRFSWALSGIPRFRTSTTDLAHRNDAASC